MKKKTTKHKGEELDKPVTFGQVSTPVEHIDDKLSIIVEDQYVADNRISNGSIFPAVGVAWKRSGILVIRNKFAAVSSQA